MLKSLARLCLIIMFSGIYAAGSIHTVLAHGKEVKLTVTSLAPDPEQPFTRLYRVLVLFEDGDPVEDAVMELTAQREEGGQTIGPVAFHSLGEPGLYATEVTYSRFGNWLVTVAASEPGKGTASFTDSVLPGQEDINVTDETADQELPENLSILFEFDGGDFLNIVFRFVHSLAGLAWFGLIGVILVARWFMSPDKRYQALLRLKSVFAPWAGISLAILLASGIYNAIWDSPIRAPGAFDVRTMAQIPFGDVYLIALFGKVAAYLVLTTITWRLWKTLQVLSTSTDPGGEHVEPTYRPSLVGLGVAVFLAVDISILIYMHYISHLSIFIPR